MSGKNGGVPQVYNIIDGHNCHSESGEWFHVRINNNGVIAAPRSGPKDLRKALNAAEKCLEKISKDADRIEELKITIVLSNTDLIDTEFTLLDLFMAFGGPVIVIAGEKLASNFERVKLANDMVKNSPLPAGIWQIIFTEDKEKLLKATAPFDKKIRIIRIKNNSWPQNEPGMDY